jgi:signal transduction histidine kinase
MRPLEENARQLARHLGEHDFSEVANALRARTRAIMYHWRKRSTEVMPELDDLTLAEFEDSVGIILEAVAAAMEAKEPDAVQHIVREAPAHGVARFAQKITPHIMLAEERILRMVIIVQLREALARPLSAEEAASLHELLDIMSEYSLLALMELRGTERNEKLLGQVHGLLRLADLGTLVAGLAHDAANLMLPLRSRLAFIGRGDLSPEAREDVESATLIVQQLQDFVTNLRFLSIDPSRGGRSSVPLDLMDWWQRVSRFHRKLLPDSITLSGGIPDGLPGPAITAAALSQVLFNLIRNAEHAMSRQEQGRITVTAAMGAPGMLNLMVEDDGPGMTAEVREHCLEPFFSTKPAAAGSGLGLAVVNSLVTGAGGHIDVQSPPPEKQRGTLFVVSLPAGIVGERLDSMDQLRKEGRDSRASDQ